VDAVANDTEASALAQAIIKLAATLHLTPVAEGVEHPDQLQRLRELRCHYGQGYHFAKPLDEQQLTALLQHQPPATHLGATAEQFDPADSTTGR
jgi:diguanylate cyclase